MRKNWIGISMMLIGTLHNLLGLVFLSSVAKELLDDGLFNTVNGQAMREAFFWFEMTGIFMIALGFVLHWCEKEIGHLPPFTPWLILGIMAIAVFIMPVSGAWLFFIPALGSYVKNKKKSPAFT